MRKYCNFCGEPMQAEARECKQCGWDVSHNGPPTTDPGDRKARIGVAAGLVVAYGVMSFLIQGTPMPARAESPRTATSVAAPEFTPEPAIAQPTVIGTPPPAVATIAQAPGHPSALISIKVADAKAANIQARDALQYAFELPETDQKCRLLGS